MATAESLQRVAQAWCTEQTATIVMDTYLVHAFADILDEELDQAQAEILRLGIEEGKNLAQAKRLKAGLSEVQAMLSCSPQHPFCRRPYHGNPEHYESHVTEVRTRLAALAEDAS